MLVDTNRDVPKDLTRAEDPLGEKVLRYTALGADKGVIFYEPLGRFEQNLSTRNVDFAANAIGLAGATALGKNGSIGVSVSYLRASLGEQTPTTSNLDTGNGVRLNLGLLYRTGPGTWGISLQNFPGFLWWESHRREMLPVRIRAGNSWKIQKRILLSAEGETRFYREGSRKENFLYFGQETIINKNANLRFGVFSDKIGKPERRHWTAGTTIKLNSGVDLTYAYEQFEINEQKVARSYVSVRIPMVAYADSN